MTPGGKSCRLLSQIPLAAPVGVSRNTIRPIEAGQCNPTAGPALILCITPGKKFGDLAYL